MHFRPCIDIHNGKVKQIIGSSLSDEGNRSVDNFVSDRDAAYYAGLYEKKSLKGGHVIILNKDLTPEYEASKAAALAALKAYPNGLMVGGGINDKNAEGFLDAGADAVIVTSFVFRNGYIDDLNLERMVRAVGREHLCLDLTCRYRDDGYYVVTDRWQRFSEEKVTPVLLKELSGACREYLIHAADVEGKKLGIEPDLCNMLGDYLKEDGQPVTYAGGIAGFEDIRKIEAASDGHLDFTVGSALDIFGGNLSFEELADRYP